MNWLTQILSISFFNLRALPERKGSALSAAFGIAGVVLVLTAVLAIAEGFKKAVTATGAPDVAVVLRSGSDSEMNSGLSREETRVISDAPGIARGSKGPLTSAELFVIIDLPKRSTGTSANVPLRGVGANAYEVRGNVVLREGRFFEPGKNEVIAGAGAARSFAGLEVGSSIKIGSNTWQVVGIFSAEGGIAESEIWTDASILQPAYKRGDTFQSVYAKLNSPGSFNEFKDALSLNPQLKPKVARLSEFYADQTTMVSDFISQIGVMIAVLMACGALFGALNTMYGAVSSRTREISTLRALGFGSGPVVVSVLVESVVLSLIGGIVGAAIAWIAFDGYQASTLNWATFSQVTFAFAVTPALLVQAIIWSVVLGLLGGVFPAVRAARLPIASALRET
ncbi:ABC transporter permease [Luteolibacter luteus]|uniref:FtsX-like permease family protein n=1 Tax=Luteolibacter luteus TaxID=2728835 RepID=A0A858RI16_9BACT|nr:ABC transporter permease [Luteolibacter luteus]QJE95870.1 FtsX-like permease family protein [Luteolibacter luteus]